MRKPCLDKLKGYQHKHVLKKFGLFDVQVVHCNVMSEKRVQELFCEEYNRKHTVLSASVVDSGRPWKNMTWVRTQLVARKVENVDTWRALEILSKAL